MNKHEVEHNHILVPLEEWAGVYYCELCDKIFVESSMDNLTYTRAVSHFSTNIHDDYYGPSVYDNA